MHEVKLFILILNSEKKIFHFFIIIIFYDAYKINIVDMQIDKCKS
jgi:hypothetical protein